ncbi:MAG TPA: glycosyltransferase [Chitinophagaceae bacterium]|nr:glycosyltransferase [Chitinophagaceae bacterium]
MKQKRILLIPGYKIFPVKTGGAYYQLVYLEKQMHDFEINIILTPENIHPDDIALFRQRFYLVKPILVGFAKKTIKEKFNRLVYKLFLRRFEKGDLSKFRKMPKVNEITIRDRKLIQQIEKISKASFFDIIQVEHSKNISLIDILPDASLKIFIEHEVFFERAAKDLQYQQFDKSSVQHIESVIRQLEISFLNKYDGIITLTEKDKHTLTNAGVSKPVWHSRYIALDKSDLQNIYQSGSSNRLLFLGNEEHFPNKDGLDWFLTKIFPMVVKENPAANLIVTGEWTNDFTIKFKNLPVQFPGFVDDLHEFLSSAILIVPIRIGGGIRIKILSAMVKGLPIVSTSVGAHGIPYLQSGNNIFIEDGAIQFANRVNQLLQSPALRNKLSENIFATAKRIAEVGNFVKERNSIYAACEAAKFAPNETPLYNN